MSGAFLFNFRAPVTHPHRHTPPSPLTLSRHGGMDSHMSHRTVRRGTPSRTSQQIAAANGRGSTRAIGAMMLTPELFIPTAYVVAMVVLAVIVACAWMRKE